MIDLHVHTTASDGKYSPREVIKKAKEEGIDVIAITDHDNINGIKEAVLAGKEYEIKVIPGVEMSATFKNEMHILGYYINYKDKEFLNFTNELIKKRKERNLKYIEYFNSIGIPMTIEDIRNLSDTDVLGKPHFAMYLVNNGYVKDTQEAFDKYFNSDELKKIRKEKFSPKEMIEKIISAGGIPVLAHPKLLYLADDELDNVVKELKEYGLKGIEVYHSEHDEDDVEKYKKLANKYKLIMTCGSDYHGEDRKYNVKLGTGKNNNVNITDKKFYKKLEYIKFKINVKNIIKKCMLIK